MKLYDYKQAAEYLMVSEYWLRENGARFERTQLGRRVFFTEEQLEQIVHAQAVRPKAPSLRGAFPQIRPVGRRAS